MKSFLAGRVTLHQGDCLDVMAGLPENSVDAIVCDPPYHLHSIVKRFAKTGRTESTASKSGPHQRTATGFMGRTWDGGDVAFRIETWAAALRVLKPGGYIVAFSSSRTFGRMSVAIEDAGFVTHPMIGWVFGQGFPKAHRVEADGWEGWRYGGQSLKPAFEPIYMGQKPFSEKNGTLNVLRWGTGALNIDGCRVETADDLNGGAYATVGGRQESQSLRPGSGMNVAGKTAGREFAQRPGRWPANLVHDGSEEVLGAFPNSDGGGDVHRRSAPKTNGIYGEFSGADDRWSGYADTGSAARFFYTAKADANDRLGSRHPTVKPVDLMQWLVRLVTPPGGLILDPFAGTGTTGQAAFREGMNAILIEREAEYCRDIERRMALCLAGPDERARATIKEKLRDTPIDAGPLFAGDAA